MHTEIRPGRQQYLALLLIWEGILTNARIRDLYGVSSVRASEWLREFRENHGSWCQWDSKLKGYLATSDLYQSLDDHPSRAILTLPHYLAQAKRNGSGRTDGMLWLAHELDAIAAPDPGAFSLIRLAIERKSGVQIRYQSLRNPLTHTRVIYPHTVVFTGQRWHCRGYSPEHGDFIDHNMGRISAIVDTGEVQPKGVEDDAAWNTYIPVEVVPHPWLTPDQALVIRQEYFKGAEKRVDHVRQAMVPYFLQIMRISTDASTQRPPEYLLFVANVDDVKPRLFSA